ncbi:hypothetical protein PF005_g20719 [Phytophthora fragariae]|nr:hypothetical protein PF010_g22991 [Phytophthora fragariae]KAE9186763.1 hypothetical protein PF005_g20719 [Phytophthora fragariae]
MEKVGEGSVDKRGRLEHAGHTADKRIRLQGSTACTSKGVKLQEHNETEDDEEYTNYFPSDDSDGGENSDDVVIPVNDRFFVVDQCLPVEIRALSHVVDHIHELLMTSSEAVVAAAQSGRIEWLEKLLDEFDCDVSEAAVSAAAANGQIEALKLLLPEVDGDYDGEVADAVAVAAGNGHLGVVQFLLPEVDDGESRNDAAWEVLEEAAARGHYDIVEFAAQQARETMDNEDTARSAGERCDALARAISGGYFDVVRLLLSQQHFH